MLRKLLEELRDAATRPERSATHVLMQFLASWSESVGVYLDSEDSAPQQFLRKALGLLSEVRPEVVRLLGTMLLTAPLTLEFWPVTKHFAILATLDWCVETEKSGRDPLPSNTTRIHLLPRTETAREFVAAQKEQKLEGFPRHSVVHVRIGEGGWLAALQLPQDRLTFLEVRNYAIVASATISH